MIADEPAAYPVAASSRHYAGHVVTVRTDEVVLPAGAAVRRDVVEHPGSVGVLALDAEDRVLLVQQYRHPPGRLLWEPPAGLLDDPGERPQAAAARELAEEAGYRAESWSVLVDAFTSPGFTDEATRVYLARGISTLQDGERQPGEHEEADMPVAWMPLDEAVEAVLAGRLHNPLAVMGVLAAKAAQARGWSGLRAADSAWPERPAAGVKG